MKMTTMVMSLTVLAGVAFCPNEKGGVLAAGEASAAPQQAEGQKPTTWSSREEYDQYEAFRTEKDPQKRIGLGEAFLQKFPNSFIKDGAYINLMQTFVQLNDMPKAIGAARKAVEANPGALEALHYLTYVFPFVFKMDDPEATAKLSLAEDDARKGLEALQKLKKPDQVSEDQFNQFIRGQRATYNGCIGFVALQRKDYAAAVASFKAATEDNPADTYTFYRLGLAHLYNAPPEYNQAIWNIARAVSLAKAAKDPNVGSLETFLKRTYVNYHGNDEGLAGILAQAATSPTPPEGFTVTQMEVPKDTGNTSVDAFNQLFFVLKYGGERAQKHWDSLKGQAFGVGGFIENVEPGPEPKSYVLKIDVLHESKAEDGVYDIELKDSTQPNVKNLGKGDAVNFRGTLASYTAAPKLVITLENGTINEDEIPDQPKVAPKPKSKPKPKPRATAKRTTAGF